MTGGGGAPEWVVIETKPWREGERRWVLWMDTGPAATVIQRGDTLRHTGCELADPARCIYTAAVRQHLSD